MKKLFALLLVAAALLALLAGCAPPAEQGTPSASPSDTAQPSAEPSGDAQGSPAGETIKVGITLLNTDNEWQSTMADHIVNYLKNAGFDPTLVSGDNDATMQMEQMENFAVMGCKVIVCQLADPDGATSMIQQVRDQGIKVVCIVFTPSEYDGLIRADQAGCGHSVAELAAEWVNEVYADAPEGSVECGLLVSTTNADAIERSEALRDIETLAPQVKVVAELEPAALTSAEAMSTTENMLISNPDIKLILCYNAALGLGANNYIISDESPISDLASVGVFCNDIDAETVAAMKASVNNEAVLRATNVINGGSEGVAKRVLYVVSGLLDGSLPEGYIYYSETDKVYPENADDFI